MLQGIVALMALMASYTVLAVLVALLVLYGVCRLLLRWDGKREGRYDERQKEAQGRAYRIAFWVGIVYLFAAMFLIQIGLSVATWLLLFLGLMLMLMTYRFCCMLLKVGNPIFRNPKESLVCDLILIGISAVDLFRGLEGWFRRGVMDSQFWFAIILGICFIVLCGVDIMELRRERGINYGRQLCNETGTGAEGAVPAGPGGRPGGLPPDHQRHREG